MWTASCVFTGVPTLTHAHTDAHNYSHNLLLLLHSGSPCDIKAPKLTHVTRMYLLANINKPLSALYVEGLWRYVMTAPHRYLSHDECRMTFLEAECKHRMYTVLCFTSVLLHYPPACTKWLPIKTVSCRQESDQSSLMMAAITGVKTAPHQTIPPTLLQASHWRAKASPQKACQHHHRWACFSPKYSREGNKSNVMRRLLRPKQSQAESPASAEKGCLMWRDRSDSCHSNLIVFILQEQCASLNMQQLSSWSVCNLLLKDCETFTVREGPWLVTQHDQW